VQGRAAGRQALLSDETKQNKKCLKMTKVIVFEWVCKNSETPKHPRAEAAKKEWV